MNDQLTGRDIVDEIDLLFVVLNKAQECLRKVSRGIDEQISTWAERRKLIWDQYQSSSLDFLLPKTQRINELAIETAQTLCHAEILMEQILRLDPKSLVTTPTRSISTASSTTTTNSVPFNSRLTNVRPPIPTETQPMTPTPLIRRPPPQLTPTTQIRDDQSFRTIDQRQSNNSPQQETFQSSMSDRSYMTRPSSTTYGLRMPHVEQRSTPTPSSSTTSMGRYRQQSSQEKVRVKLQKIAPGTSWREAMVGLVDSLSGFFVENLDATVKSSFDRMTDDLDNYYTQLQRGNKLTPISFPSIGDFGVAKYSEHSRWYRARVVLFQENEIVVVFIDYGYLERKSMNEFFTLEREFAKLPAQAVACTLSKASPLHPNSEDGVWSSDTVEIFKQQVANRKVAVYFCNKEDGTDNWPLPFVELTMNNQTIVNMLALKQHIAIQPNKIIAEQLADTVKEELFLTFNIPISPDEAV